MTYSFSAHLAGLVPPAVDQPADAPASRTYALVDAGQLGVPESHWRRATAGASFMRLFENTFASPALELSPLVFELAADAATRQDQILGLDESCRRLPALSIVRSAQPLDAFVKRLRALLAIDADGTSYLLRFCDSQMLAACNAVLLPHQRTEFFRGVDAWFTVDHRGGLVDEAAPSLREHAVHGTPLPLRLDEAQTHALLEAAAGPILAGQMRHFEPPFAQAFTHGQQVDFVTRGVAAARAAGVVDDVETMAWLMDQWRTERGSLA